ncbi:MAG TPA: methylmalonyl-CoA mutase family protein [Candidatus Saccharimonadales bacterium]|nr:methylmalonyl-CoA mutase family protein [Candidatus Saccharimonadales bacterium]
MPNRKHLDPAAAPGVPRPQPETAGLDAACRAWQESLRDAAPPRAISFDTISGVPNQVLYTPLDVRDLDYQQELGFPGEFPYTRGIHPSMYRHRLWTMRQFSGFGSARDTNRRYKFLLQRGQTGLSVAFDNPTIMGYDSDHALAKGEVGVTGVAVDSLADMEVLFEGIDPGAISTSMTINGPAAILFAFYLACAEKRGVPLARLRGTLQNDILKEYIAQKTWCFPPLPSMRVITDLMAFCARNVPQWNTISISGYHIREAGATAGQELAFTLADGFAYVEAGIAAGLDVDEFAPRLSFFWNSHLDFFEEIAKYRAARRIWARTLRDKYRARKPESWLMRFHTQTAGVSLVAQQPENNIVRTAYEALAAVLGGTQSLHTNSMDETLALPSEKAVQIALRTQQILAYETGVVNTIDPLAGSYYVEAATRRLEQEAEAYFREIERRGGVIRCLEEGYLQREIARSAYRYQQEIERRERIIVGVNDFVTDEPLTIPILRIDEEVERQQVAALRKLRESRDGGAVRERLAALTDAARTGRANLVERILECARVYATEGEIRDALREVFGDYREPADF